MADRATSFPLAPRGFEQSKFKPPKTTISRTERAESGALPDEKPLSDPDLALIQERWPELPEHIKAAVLALVRGCTREG